MRRAGFGSGSLTVALLLVGAGCGGRVKTTSSGPPVPALVTPSGRPSSAPPAAAAASAAAQASTRPATRPFLGGAGSVRSTGGVVVAVETHAARVGARVLEAGGNAVDAAVATTFALCVTHPSAASLGGGGFALVRPRSGPTTALDFRETAPAALTRPAFDAMIARGARDTVAVGVPGTVAGLAAMHARFGRRPFAELVAPAIALARDGYSLGRFQARALGWSYAALAGDASLRAAFGAAGKPKPEGSHVTWRELSVTLERLASAGPEDFYRGAIASALVAGLLPHGPSAGDLAAYRAVVREPLSFPYRGFDVQTMPPPSAGGVALAGVLLSLERLLPTPPDAPSAQAIHHFLEAARRAQAERRLAVVDPDSLAPEELRARLARVLEVGAWLTVPVDPERATPSHRVHPLYSAALRETEHTTHLSVADREGMVVSLTTTLSASFGAKLTARGTGVVMNNAVASFASVGDNQPVPRRRTTSSMAPTLLLRGPEVAAVLGTPGGDTIPSTLAQIILRLVDHREPLDAAVLAPRFHHGFVPDVARYEASKQWPASLLSDLRERGHRLRPFRGSIGDANCIVLDDTAAHGFADPRELGSAIAAVAP